MIGFQRLAICVLLVMSAVAAPARGDEFRYGLKAGGNYSDNLERVQTNEQSTSAAVAGLDVRAAREAGRLLYDAFGNLEYQHYLDSNADDQTFGQVSGRASYALIPGRFIWGLSGTFDQVRQDLLRPIAPSNLEDVTTLSTQPQLNLRLGTALDATLEAHYTIADYSERPFDSDTVGGSTIVGWRSSARGYVGLGVSGDKVSYTNEGASGADFDRREYFLRFTADGMRTDLQIDAGYSTIEGDNFDGDGPMARARVTRRLTPSLSAIAAYTREFPTSARAAFTPAVAEDSGVDPSVLTGAPRESESAELGLNWQAGRTATSLSYVRRDETPLEAVTTRNFDDLHGSVTRFMGSRSSLTLFASFIEEDFDGTNATEEIYGGRVNLNLGRLLILTLGIGHRTRDSDDPTGSYTETHGGLYLRYGSSAVP
jgi:hypothetical protein